MKYFHIQLKRTPLNRSEMVTLLRSKGMNYAADNYPTTHYNLACNIGEAFLWDDTPQEIFFWSYINCKTFLTIQTW